MIANVTSLPTATCCCCCEAVTKVAGPDPWWAVPLLFLTLAMGIAFTLSAFAPFGRNQ